LRGEWIVRVCAEQATEIESSNDAKAQRLNIRQWIMNGLLDGVGAAPERGATSQFADRRQNSLSAVDAGQFNRLYLLNLPAGFQASANIM
jgi:hypothetical protein